MNNYRCTVSGAVLRFMIFRGGKIARLNKVRLNASMIMPLHGSAGQQAGGDAVRIQKAIGASPFYAACKKAICHSAVTRVQPLGSGCSSRFDIVQRPAKEKFVAVGSCRRNGKNEEQAAGDGSAWLTILWRAAAATLAEDCGARPLHSCQAYCARARLAGLANGCASWRAISHSTIKESKMPAAASTI